MTRAGGIAPRCHRVGGLILSFIIEHLRLAPGATQTDAAGACQASGLPSRSAGLRWHLVERTSELISAAAIADRVDELAARIDEDYADAGELILIGVLKGSFIFLSDLARRLTIPHRVEFISVSSYGDRESEEAGAVRLIMDVRHAIVGKHVLVVEDIVDTGHTLTYLIRLLRARGPASLKACTLLHKPERSEVDVDLEYIGFTIPDAWVVGYGLDFAERHRTLPNLCILDGAPDS